MTFLIADLAGYTALAGAHGDADAAKAASRFAALAEMACIDSRVVKTVGDAVIAVGTTPEGAIRTALRLKDLVEAEELFPDVSMGLAGGPAIEQDGDYFGNTINIAARVCSHAKPGQILCTGALRHTVADLDDLELHPIGEVRLKNVVQPMALFELVEVGAPSRSPAIDPVCRMKLDLEVAPARLPHDGVTYFFCSLACARAFAEQPEAYVEAL